jgi:hypothetical protein
MYWGDQAAFLSTMNLRNLELRDFLLQSTNPASVEVSAANLVWPKLAYPFGVPNAENSLSDIWSESPLVLIGDRIITLITVHKTLCTIDQGTVRPLKYREAFNAKAYVIDRNFEVRETPVDIPQDYAAEVFTKRRNEPSEAIFIKFVRIKHDPTIKDQKPYIRYVIYPFESIKLFRSESFGTVLSLASIKLRESYLRSKHPFNITLTSKDLVKSLETLVKLPFGSFIGDEFVFKLLESDEGMRMLALGLGLYEYENSTFKYIHPSLFECVLTTLKNRISKIELKGLLRIGERYLEERSQQPESPISPITIEELFKEELGIRINFGEAKLFARSLYYLTNVIIPLSKGLNYHENQNENGR